MQRTLPYWACLSFPCPCPCPIFSWQPPSEARRARGPPYPRRLLLDRARARARGRDAASRLQGPYALITVRRCWARLSCGTHIPTAAPTRPGTGTGRSASRLQGQALRPHHRQTLLGEAFRVSRSNDAPCARMCRRTLVIVTGFPSLTSAMDECPSSDASTMVRAPPPTTVSFFV